MAIRSKKNIWVAAGDGDLDRVVELIEQHNTDPNAPDENTYTPMHAAASYGHLHILDYLITRGGDINITDSDGDTPLYTVENIETAQFLVQHGAVVTRRNDAGISPIEHLKEDFPHISTYLESLFPLSTPDNIGPAVRHAAPVSISQHSQDTVSETLTNTLMQRIQDVMQRVEEQGGAEVNEEQIRQVVATTVLEGVARGYEFQHENRESEDTSEKRTRIE